MGVFGGSAHGYGQFCARDGQVRGLGYKIGSFCSPESNFGILVNKIPPFLFTKALNVLSGIQKRPFLFTRRQKETPCEQNEGRGAYVIW